MPVPRRTRGAVHELRVAGVQALTDDAIAVELAVPDALRDTFAFVPGQHLTFVSDAGGESIRRAYSICSAPDGPLRVAVKRLPGGAFSTWAHTEMQVGDALSVMAPDGRFTLDTDPARRAHYAAVAAGSGITPVLAILTAALEREPESRCTLVYGNRATSSIMFLDDLSDLKDRFGERLAIVHVLSREPQEVALAEGRVDAAKLTTILDTLLDPKQVDEWFLCGPFAMVQTARATLRERGVAASAIHRELFHDDDGPVPTPTAHVDPDGGGASVTIRLDGRTTELTVAPDGPVILEAALALRPDAPFSCRGGVCGTCRCRVREGEVRMDHVYALEEDEIAAGVVLACQAHPVSDRVVLDFDAG